MQTIRIAQGLDFQTKFLKVFNVIHKEAYHLVPSTQEFDVFDYYLFKKDEIEPYIIELKTRPGKMHGHFEDTLFDYLKLLKLRSLSRKGSVIICYEDMSLVIDINLVPDKVLVGQFDGREKPVALYSVDKLKKLSISLETLRLVE